MVSHPDTASYSDAVSHSEAMSYGGGSQTIINLNTNRGFSSQASRKVYSTCVHDVGCSFARDQEFTNSEILFWLAGEDFLIRLVCLQTVRQ